MWSKSAKKHCHTTTHSNFIWQPLFPILITHLKLLSKWLLSTLLSLLKAWKNRCWLKLSLFKTLILNKKRLKSSRKMLLTRKNFWTSKILSWNPFLKPKEASMKFWWTKPLSTNSNQVRNSQLRSIKESKIQRWQKLRLIKQDSHIGQLLLELVCFTSVFLICQVSTLCISILFNGSAISSWWVLKTLRHQMFLKKD